ncbi:MAG: hypothetical protein HY301_12725 [Verrucomicrobia bacterium]|nr:hypothetical protein [Verrucomicrobiota bacterium]
MAPAFRRLRGGLRFVVIVILLALFAGPSARTARAALQFDVFPGFDGKVMQTAWFPMTFEIFNDGPPFDAVIEIAVGLGAGSGQKQLIPVELPTNTRKRVSAPVFSAGGGYARWDCRLLDRRGRVIAERKNLAMSLQLAQDSRLVGALPRTLGGMPTLPQLSTANVNQQPAIARLQVEQFPDNPIALEALSAIFLHSEKAIELKQPQITALLAWLQGGGHLVVAVEQPGDVNATGWLRDLLPCSLGGVGTLEPGEAFDEWLPNATNSGPAIAETAPPTSPPPGLVSATVVTNITTNAAGVVTTTKKTPRPRPYVRPKAKAPQPLPKLSADEKFNSAQLPIVLATPREGATVSLEADGRPLIIEARRGRGTITALAFSPDREPFNSWRHRQWFWVKACDIPPQLLRAEREFYGAGESADGLFGALVDSKQVHKLPFGWLVLLLLGYLLVIGPFDQVMLKKLNRQMLTWITFPLYVAGFSFLVYFIGYALRAGENEWNEIHVVDVLARGDQATLRGRTYASIYSSANRRYPVAGDPAALGATLRGELISWGQASQMSDQGRVVQRGNNYLAELYVPVWTTFLCASDWTKNAPAPVRFTVSTGGATNTVEIENLLNRPLKEVRVVLENNIYELGTVAAKEKKKFLLAGGSKTTTLASFVNQHANEMMQAARARHQTFGGFGGQARPELNPALTVETACFITHLRNAQAAQNQQLFAPPGLDLSPAAARGDAILLAFVEDYSASAPLNQFSPRRGWKHTLLRVVEPVVKEEGQ